MPDSEVWVELFRSGKGTLEPEQEFCCGKAGPMEFQAAFSLLDGSKR